MRGITRKWEWPRPHIRPFHIQARKYIYLSSLSFTIVTHNRDWKSELFVTHSWDRQSALHLSPIIGNDNVHYCFEPYLELTGCVLVVTYSWYWSGALWLSPLVGTEKVHHGCYSKFGLSKCIIVVTHTWDWLNVLWLHPQFGLTKFNMIIIHSWDWQNALRLSAMVASVGWKSSQTFRRFYETEISKLQLMCV